MRNTFRHLFKQAYVRWSVFRFCLCEYKYLRTHLCTSNTFNKREKLRYSLILQSHIIEKGLSLDDVKLGFGIPKIRRLLSDLQEYVTRYGDHETLYFVLSIVKQYISFHQSQGYEVDGKIQQAYSALSELMNDDTIDKYKDYCGGVLEIQKTDIMNNSFPYDLFVSRRHSIRSFTGEPVSLDIIHTALKIAESTPSACNRQPWDIYVCTNKDNIIRILDIQSGARQFKDKVSALVLVCSTANAFSITEGHQPYVNGGLYAMNLMLAFHSLNIGSIPLNLGIDPSRIKELRGILKMPEDSIPVLLLAIGQVPERIKVACSKRFPFYEYTHFD